MIKDAVKAAIQHQKEAHDEAMQKLVDEHKATHSPLSGTNLTKTSGISYIQWGESIPHLSPQWLDHP